MGVFSKRDPLPYCWAYYDRGQLQKEMLCSTDFVEVNDAVYKWYCLARHTCFWTTSTRKIAKGIDADT